MKNKDMKNKEKKEKKELSYAASGLIGFFLVFTGAALNIITVEILLDISKWFVLIAILGAVVSLVGSFFAFSVTDGCKELDFPDDFMCLVFGTLLIMFALAVCGLTSFVIASIFYG